MAGISGYKRLGISEQLVSLRRHLLLYGIMAGNYPPADRIMEALISFLEELF
jgi:hypothetical protein